VADPRMLPPPRDFYQRLQGAPPVEDQILRLADVVMRNVAPGSSDVASAMDSQAAGQGMVSAARAGDYPQAAIEGLYAALAGAGAMPMIPSLAGIILGPRARKFTRTAGDIIRPNWDPNIPRKEISDVDMKLDPSWAGTRPMPEFIDPGDALEMLMEPKKVGEILDHPEFFANYPEAKNILVEPMDPNVETLGFYNPNENVLGLNKKLPTMTEHDTALQMATERERMNPWEIAGGPRPEDNTLEDVLLHELTHFVQSKEGMVSGQNPSRLFHPDAYNIGEKLRELDIDRQWGKVKLDLKQEKVMEDLVKELDMYENDVFQKYRAAGGEVEARAVQDKYKDQFRYPFAENEPYLAYAKPGKFAPYDPSKEGLLPVSDYTKMLYETLLRGLPK
jgi:hypothetical protein